MGISYVWQTHPFRDGNTRTIVAYALKFAQEHGFKLDEDLILQHFDYIRGGLVWASQGNYSDFSYLNKIFKDAILRQQAKDAKGSSENAKKNKGQEEQDRSI